MPGKKAIIIGAGPAGLTAAYELLTRSDVKPIVAAKILYGSLDEMVTNWVLSKKAYPLAPMAGEVLNIFLGGLSTK